MEVFMSELRKPDEEEPLRQPGTRSARLRELVDGVLLDNDNISLIYWSQKGDGRWVAWEGPDALDEAGVTLPT